jgi:hypothetical protein
LFGGRSRLEIAAQHSAQTGMQRSLQRNENAFRRRLSTGWFSAQLRRPTDDPRPESSYANLNMSVRLELGSSINMSRTLVWILAGGAVLALGGAAIWLWRKRSKSAKRNGEQPPPPEPGDTPSPETEKNTMPPRATTQTSAATDTQPKATKAAYLAGDQFGLFTSTASTPASATPSAPEAAAIVTSEPAAEVEAPAEGTAPAVLIPKGRRKRYPVGPGELIELHPDRTTSNTSWSTSRPDVEVRVIEQDASRALVALDGPAGQVNVALLCAGPKGPRPITSWKFEIVDKVA